MKALNNFLPSSSAIVACVLCLAIHTGYAQEAIQVFDVVPSAPTDLSARSRFADQVDLSWDDNSDNETSFLIERSVGDINHFELLFLTGANTRYVSDQTVSPNTSYYYKVSATNENGISAFSNVYEVRTLDRTVSNDKDDRTELKPGYLQYSLSGNTSGGDNLLVYPAIQNQFFYVSLTNRYSEVSLRLCDNGGNEINDGYQPNRLTYLSANNTINLLDVRGGVVSKRVAGL